MEFLEATQVIGWQKRELEFVQQHIENVGNATQVARAVECIKQQRIEVGHRLKSRLSRKIGAEQPVFLIDRLFRYDSVQLTGENS